MPGPISAADGPVAVTGASGYIGASVCHNLVQHGYTVRACVRDASRKDRTAHLLAMNAASSSGSLALFPADMLDAGSYDSITEAITMPMPMKAPASITPTATF